MMAAIDALDIFCCACGDISNELRKLYFIHGKCISNACISELAETLKAIRCESTSANNEMKQEEAAVLFE